MNEFDDLFSTDGIRRESPVLSALPWEAEDAPSLLKWLRPALDTCAKIQDAAFVAEITGECPSPEWAFGDSPALEQFRKIIPLPTMPTAPKAAADLWKLACKVERLQKGASDRLRRIAGILGDFRGKLGGRPKDQEIWDQLQRTCEQTTAALILAA